MRNVDIFLRKSQFFPKKKISPCESNTIDVHCLTVNAGRRCQHWPIHMVSNDMKNNHQMESSSYFET